MAKTAEMIINEDMRNVYLGNLNTVEFNLKLPRKGRLGSTITWYSDNELFLRPDGSVTRPMNGIGDRKVHLCGCFQYEGLKKEKVYEVHILEEESKVEMKEVLPLVRKAEVEKEIHLPQAVVLRGDNEHLFSRRVEWEGGNVRVFEKCGTYSIRGKVRDEILPAQLTVLVEEHAEVEKKETASLVCAMEEGEIRLGKGSVFYEAMNRAVQYFKSINDDEMLYNFRKTAQLDTCGAPAMQGWDSPECLLRGHTTGHYLSALSLCYRETKDEEILCKLNYLVEELGRCQDVFSRMEGYRPGYIGAYSEEQFDLLEKGEKYPDIWAPYYTLHKLLAGLLDAYYETDNKRALDIAVKAAHWIYERLSRLTENEREQMWDTYIAGEFGGMNETLARLYEITGKEEFLITAKMFDNDRLLVPMEEKKDVLEGMHANQHIPQIIGCMELFKATGEKRYYDIAEFFWKTVTGAHIYVNGGAGQNEMFFEPDAAERYLTMETTEYCVSYNMLKLTKELFRYCPQAYYMDYYERTMFNHIVAGFDHKPTGETTYFYPLAPGAVKDSKFVNSCCHGTGMESQMKYTEAIYFHTEKELYINLFVNSVLEWREKGLLINQEIDEDDPGKVKLSFEGDGECTLKIRCPYWCGGVYEAAVNNGKVVAKCGSDGYIIIERNRTVEKIELRFRCDLRIERIHEKGDVAALTYGPYVLAALSDKRDYLEYDIDKMDAVRGKEGRLRFITGGENPVTWVPLSDVKDERFHVYWKII